MKYGKIKYMGIILSMGLLFTACHRDLSSADISSIEDTKMVIPEEVQDFSAREEATMEPSKRDFSLTSYLDDSHFYKNSVTINVSSDGLSWNPVKVVVEKSFSSVSPEEGGEYFANSQNIKDGELNAVRNQYYQKENICYLFLDMIIENPGTQNIEYSLGNLKLFSRVEDNSYVSEGFGDKCITAIMPGMCDYEMQMGDSSQGLLNIEPGGRAMVRIAYILNKDDMSETLCVQTGNEDLGEYNENTQRNEPTKNENVKFIYIE